jgi:hypothetical protein
VLIMRAILAGVHLRVLACFFDGGVELLDGRLIGALGGAPEGRS